MLAGQALLDADQLQLLDRFPELNVQEKLGRVYPLDGVGASLVGFYNVDPDSVAHRTGLELGLDTLLARQPGRAMRVRSARRGEDHGEVVVEPAHHGSRVTLSLDADLQEICEARLAAAVQNTRSQSGSILIMDPATGDVLAAASWPLVATRERPVGDQAVWVNRNFTVPYEPGSVFKIFTAAALLTCGAVDTASVIDCSNNQFQGFTIREAVGHSFGQLTFNEAFTHSSNVWFARAVDNIAPREHHRMLLDFGFGRGTDAPYPGERDGTIAQPDSWSVRTQATMAIGQELAATPLQLALALSAVANGGMLMAPRLYTDVHDHQGQLVRHVPPRPLRRVLPESICEPIVQAMTQVVDHGTGVAAKRDWVAVAGKTGTAQKALPKQGYVPGLHVATFAGFLPSDDPQLVIVAVLDEPPYEFHYAAQSAAPLFGGVVDDIRRTTHWLEDPSRHGVAVSVPADRDRVTVPDVLYLDAERAVQRLELAALAVAGPVTSGQVIMQVPAAGSRVARGATVTLTLQDGEPASEVLCPDCVA